MTASAFSFSTAHPHYTPGWLSAKVAELIPSRFCGRVVDPACGAGNLLAAAVHRTNGAERSADEVEFVGADVSRQAVKSCSRVLAGLLPNRNFTVERQDFLQATPRRAARPTVVVMNPPFRGYGELEAQVRRQVAKKLQLKGRFNLGYAFVCNAVDLYRPVQLVSILPSNWIYSRGSAFRDELEQREGTWEWEDVGDAFKQVNAHVGILSWRSWDPLESTCRHASLSIL